jgi:hypothetical protein
VRLGRAGLARMNNTTIILGIVYEVISVVFIYKLWTRKRRVPVVERCLLTVALLVPFAGWFIYLFLAPSPSEHPDNLREHYDGNMGDSPPPDHSSSGDSSH